MFDVNAKVGQWPYRPVDGLEGTLRKMDALGIERAAVSSLSAVHYFNPQDGNDELARTVDAHRDRLTPLAVVRPNFSAWADDLIQCLDGYGMRGVVLHPNYHRFVLANSDLDVLVEACATRRVPVCIQAGLEDPRRQFYRTIVEDVPAVDIGAFARRYPEVTVIALGVKYDSLEQLGVPWPDNLSADLSNYERLGELEHAVKRYGADRFLFGTNAPLFHPRANVDKLQCADLTAEQRNAIARANAEAIFFP